MAITKERKRELVAEYADLLNRSKAIIFAEYRGMNNAQMTALRRALREVGGAYHVTKLSLLKLALAEAGYPLLEGELKGAPIAVGFCLDEVPPVAKTLVEHAKESGLLVLRGGLMGTSRLSAKDVEALAELPSLDVLRAQLLGLLDAPAANLVGVIQAGVAQIVNVLSAYAEQGDEAAAEVAAS